jgi:hypothetical protein
MAKEELNVSKGQEQEENVQANEEQDVENTQEQDDEDYFNPFVEDEDGQEEEVQEDKGEEEGEDKEKVKDTKTEQEGDPEARARLDAIDVVDEFLEENEEYVEIKKELRELTAKAIQRGYKNPIEFARRNAKSPDYWVKVGERRAKEAIENAQSSTIRATSASAGVGAKGQDYDSMPKGDFEQMVQSVKSNR